MEFQNKKEIRLSDFVTAGLLKSISRRSTEIAGLIRIALDDVQKEDREVRLSALLGAVAEDIESWAKMEAGEYGHR